MAVITWANPLTPKYKDDPTAWIGGVAPGVNDIAKFGPGTLNIMQATNGTTVSWGGVDATEATDTLDIYRAADGQSGWTSEVLIFGGSLLMGSGPSSPAQNWNGDAGGAAQSILWNTSVGRYNGVGSTTNNTTLNTGCSWFDAQFGGTTIIQTDSSLFYSSGDFVGPVIFNSGGRLDCNGNAPLTFEDQILLNAPLTIDLYNNNSAGFFLLSNFRPVVGAAGGKLILDFGPGGKMEFPSNPPKPLRTRSL